ncbi:hypothetical protein, partial [Shewanella chilikensis]|uniref:hypothetical protein n=1 Tax=Shewanella chilikensis TaxID=558541 RepID=UPI003A9874E3
MQGMVRSKDRGCSKFCVTLKITDRCEHPVVLQNGWTAEIALNSSFESGVTTTVDFEWGHLAK